MARRHQIESARAERGLTLVELLVAMAILALAASVAIINAPPARDATRAAANAFADDVRGAVDRAVTTGAAYRLEIEPGAYHVARFENGEWTRLADAVSAEDAADLFIRVEIDEEAKSNALALYGAGPERRRARDRDAPIIVPVDPYGLSPAFTVVFQGPGGRSYVVRREASGAVAVTRQ